MAREHNRRSILKAIVAGGIGGLTIKYPAKVGELIVGGTTRFESDTPGNIHHALNDQSCNGNETARFFQQCHDPEPGSPYRNVPGVQMPNLPELPVKAPPMSAEATYALDGIEQTVEEEGFFRALPSYLLSLAQHSDTAVLDVLGGTKDPNLNSDEILVGAATSIVYGLAHNISYMARGVKRVEPHAYETVLGLGFFYLQRKFGVLGSSIAHVLNNYSVGEYRLGKRKF